MNESICANCGAVLAGEYCAACGQRRFRPRDRRMAHLLGESFDALTDFDGRIWRSLRAALLQPGRIARADGDAGAFRREALREREADAAAAAGDEDDLVAQVQVHRCSFGAARLTRELTHHPGEYFLPVALREGKRTHVRHGHAQPGCSPEPIREC